MVDTVMLLLLGMGFVLVCWAMVIWGWMVPVLLLALLVVVIGLVALSRSEAPHDD